MQPKMALEGIKVLDLTQYGAGPMCAELLSYWGAEVIKIEHPVRGDSMRGQQIGGGVTVRKQGIYNYMFENVNFNKKSIAVDLEQPEGQEIIYKLVASSDVFVAAMRTREVEKFGIQYETLKAKNPKLVYALLTGYGTEGADKDEPGFDTVAFFDRSGISYMLADSQGAPPWPRPGLGDIPSGTYLAGGIMLALFVRERTGIGQSVTTSLFHSGMWTLAADTMHVFATHNNPKKHIREAPDNPIANYYKTKDNRWILLYLLKADAFWPRVCEAIGRRDIINDPRFNSIPARAKNSAALVRIIDEVIATRTLDEWKRHLAKFQLIFSPVQTPLEAFNDPQAKANNHAEIFEHPVWGPIELCSPPLKLSETPGSIRTPAPEWGQHTEETLLSLGYGWDDISSLKNKKIIP